MWRYFYYLKSDKEIGQNAYCINHVSTKAGNTMTRHDILVSANENVGFTQIIKVTDSFYHPLPKHFSLMPLFQLYTECRQTVEQLCQTLLPHQILGQI